MHITNAVQCFYSLIKIVTILNTPFWFFMQLYWLQSKKGKGVAHASVPSQITFVVIARLD